MTKRKKCKGPWKDFWEIREDSLSWKNSSSTALKTTFLFREWTLSLKPTGRQRWTVRVAASSLLLSVLLFLLVLFRQTRFRLQDRKLDTGRFFFHSRLPVCSVLPAARPHCVHCLTHTKSIMSEWGSEGWHLQAATLVRGAVTLKKRINQNVTTTKLTTKQPFLAPKLQRWTVTWSCLFLLWLLVPQCFLCFVDLFCFSWISPPPSSLISMALWLQAAHPRVEKTALQCTKKSKLNQKCCSWCLFYTVVLLAFLLLYMMKISKLYQMTWKLTIQTTWNFRLLRNFCHRTLLS